VPLTVRRGGKKMVVSLPVTTRDNRLIRYYEGEKPSYFIHGPLVFSPVKGDAISLYFRLNAGIYGSNSPLVTRRFDRAQFPGEELVVVTRPMFDHKIAKGYDDPVGRVVKEVNGIRIKNLVHLVETLRDSKDTYLKFRFADEGSEVLVFDRKEMDRVTEEIMEDNGIAPTRRGSQEALKAWKKGAAPSKSPDHDQLQTAEEGHGRWGPDQEERRVPPLAREMYRCRPIRYLCPCNCAWKRSVPGSRPPGRRGSGLVSRTSSPRPIRNCVPACSRSQHAQS